MKSKHIHIEILFSDILIGLVEAVIWHSIASNMAPFVLNVTHLKRTLILSAESAEEAGKH